MQSRLASPEFHHHARLITIAGVLVLGSLIALRLEWPRPAVAVLAMLAVGIATASMYSVLQNRRR